VNQPVTDPPILPGRQQPVESLPGLDQEEDSNFGRMLPPLPWLRLGLLTCHIAMGASSAVCRRLKDEDNSFDDVLGMQAALWRLAEHTGEFAIALQVMVGYVMGVVVVDGGSS